MFFWFFGREVTIMFGIIFFSWIRLGMGIIQKKTPDQDTVLIEGNLDKTYTYFRT